MAKTVSEMRKIDKKMLLAAWSCNNKFWVIHQAYHTPLRQMFTQVKNFDPQEEIYRYGRDEMNRRFLQTLKEYKPDYIMLFLVGDDLKPETLMEIKRILPNAVVFQWNGDDDIKFDNYTVPYSAVIDYQWISQLQFTKRYNKYKLPWFDVLGADIKKFYHIPGTKKEYDVVFVGTPKGERLEYMRYLLKNKVNFILAGGGWKEYPEFKDRYLGQLTDEEFVKVINESKINICFSKNYFSSPHLLERSLQVNACKAFALTGYVNGYFEKFTEGKDFASFKTKEELLEKINYYLKNEKEREKIADNAYKKITGLYSNQKMFWDAFQGIEKDLKRKKKLHSGIASSKYLGIRPTYLDKDDFKRGREYIIKKIGNAKYIAFKNKGHEVLPYRDFFQIYTMELIKERPMSLCNSFLNSRLIGDYATLDLIYAYKYLKDRKYFLENADISQFIVRRDYFLENMGKFASLYNGKKPEFVNLNNTTLISMSLIRTRKIKPIPIRDIEHILFAHLELELLVLRSQKRVWKSSYIYRLMLYSLVNPQIMKLMLLNVIKRTKNKKVIKISKFFEKVF